MDLVLKPKVMEDIRKLPQDVQDECFEVLEKLIMNVNLGKSLEQQDDIDLRGCFKLYFHKAQFRIIYKKKVINSISTPAIYGIGKRDNKEIYREVAKRLDKEKKTSVSQTS